jgi:hypothetical protein
VATATGFSDGFLMVAAVVLALDLFLGLASLGRMVDASAEDLRYVQGMNRLRHAYHEMVPGLERYFISKRHDDIASVLAIYGTGQTSGIGALLHALTTTPVMVGVICSAVGGALAAVVVTLTTHAAIWAGLGGLVAFLVTFVVISTGTRRRVNRSWASLDVAFPSDERPRS